MMNESIHPEDTASICVPKYRDSKHQKQNLTELKGRKQSYKYSCMDLLFFSEFIELDRIFNKNISYFETNVKHQTKTIRIYILFRWNGIFTKVYSSVRKRENRGFFIYSFTIWNVKEFKVISEDTNAESVF